MRVFFSPARKILLISFFFITQDSLHLPFLSEMSLLIFVLFFGCLHLVRSKIDSDFQCAAIPKGDGWNCYQKVVSQENTCDGAWYKANSTVVSNGITYTVYIGTVGNPSTTDPINCGSAIGVSYELYGYVNYIFQSNWPNGWQCGIPPGGNRDQHVKFEAFGYPAHSNPTEVMGISYRMLQVSADNAVASPDGNTYSSFASGSVPTGAMTFRKCDGSTFD